MEKEVSTPPKQDGGVGRHVKQLTVLSGKGGTGKTTLTASFAALSSNAVFADCDVDASNLHLLLKPQIVQKQEFKGSKLAVIDEAQCIKCGRCKEACRFRAIKDFVIDPILCEGCGVCVYVCPVKAIEHKEQLSGYAFISNTEYGPMSHARLNPGAENSGKLVTLVRHNARLIAEKEKRTLILNDGPPGIGCPVIASITGVDAGLVVVEPTLSGIYDLERALSLLNHFQVRGLVCINRYDINEENSKKIVEFCASKSIDVVGKIPFDPSVTRAMVQGMPVVEHFPRSDASRNIKETWKQILSFVSQT
jgi:MinD superfamily P-loop ATPase